MGAVVVELMMTVVAAAAPEMGPAMVNEVEVMVADEELKAVAESGEVAAGEDFLIETAQTAEMMEVRMTYLLLT